MSRLRLHKNETNEKRDFNFKKVHDPREANIQIAAYSYLAVEGGTRIKSATPFLILTYLSSYVFRVYLHRHAGPDTRTALDLRNKAQELES